MTPSQPATLLFSGHSNVGSGGTAEDILFGPDDYGPLPMPQRVLLSSCESAGSGGQGRGEWLGLSAAMLLRGARQVLGTGWSIADSAATRRLEEELVAGLQSDENPAEMLRRSQLLRLALWRLTSAETAANPDEDVERPLTWAAFQAIGVRS
jgi:CHAT domain-containing protein